MYELLAFVACLVVPLALFIGIIALVWRVNQPSANANASLLPMMQQQIEAWVGAGRISFEDAAPVLRVIDAELAPPVVAAPVELANIAQPVVTPVQPTVVPTPPVPQATPVAAAHATPTPVEPAPPQEVRPSWAERAWTGVLALRTRQMLLFLGAFLLLISSLVLVVFNWGNFPPPLQCLLLAAICGGLWFAGEWLERKWAMPSAGAGLRAVSGVLVPVVAFAMTQLLGMKLHHAWLLASLASLPFYAWAAWRTRQRLFSVMGSLAGASLLMAVCGFFSWPALPAVLCLGLVAYLPLAQKLRGVDQRLADGPFWVAHTLVPATAFMSGALYLGDLLALGWLGAVLWSGVLFYAVGSLIDRRAVWAWLAGALGPAALLAVLGELLPNQQVQWSAALIGLCTLYLVIAHWLHARGWRDHANGIAMVGHLLAPFALVVAGLLGWGSGEAALAFWLGAGFYVVAVLLAPLAHWSVLAAGGVAAALVATGAALGPGEHREVELALLALGSVYLCLGRWLRANHRTVAVGPLLVAHTGVPIVLAFTCLTLTNTWADAALLWATVAFYLLALALDRHARWLWPTLAVAAFGWAQTGVVLEVGATPLNATLACVALGYLVLAVVLEPRVRAFALPGYCVGAVLSVIVGLAAFGQGIAAMQWSLPTLVACCALIVGATHKQRGNWLSPSGRAILASIVLGLGSFLWATWLWVLFDLVPIATAWRAVILLVLPAAAFVAAHTWPGVLRKGYPLALRCVGVVLAFVFGALTSGQHDAAVVGMALLAGVWLLQLCLQRHSAWAALMLGTAAVAVGLTLDRFAAPQPVWFLSGILLVAVYTLGAARARGSGWQSLVWPGTLIGSLIGGLVLATVLRMALVPTSLENYHILAVLALAALAAAHSAIWRQVWLGYVAGPLLALAVTLATSIGFFLGWQPQAADYAYVLCGTVVLLLTIGEALRRFAPRYASPYELLGFALVVAAPLAAGIDPQHAALTWLTVALVFGYGTFRHQQPIGMLPALLAADVALVFAAGWRWPGDSLEAASGLLLGAAWAQAILALNARRFWAALRRPVYTATALTGCATLFFAALAGLSNSFNGGSLATPMAVAGFGLAALLALVASVEEWELGGWGALGLLGIALASTHLELEIASSWSMSYGVMESLALIAIGWALDVLAKRGGTAGALAIWRRPLLFGPLAAAVGLTITATVTSLETSSQLPAVFALVMLGLVFATVAVRQRSIGFAYAAGGALVAATLLQLFDWQVREPQGYVIPAGLYLLALADGLRRFQGKRQLSRLLECAALSLMLGTAATQAVGAEGVHSLLLTVVLCAEAFLLLVYGSVRRLQVPFVGGAAGFMFGVLWLGVDPLRATNTWVVMGLLGLGLVGLYVLLERRQEQLVQAGRAWIERVSTWG